MTHWISLDWDYITGDCHSQADACSSECCNCGSHQGRGIKGAESFKDWQQRFSKTIVKLNRLHIAVAYCFDNHGEIFRFLQSGDVVDNFDYHTDDYDAEPLSPVACWNWVNYAEMHDITVNQHYNIADLNSLSENETYKLFIAWSQPYTPEELDRYLLYLIFSMPCEVRINALPCND